MGTVKITVRAIAESKEIANPFILASVTGINYATCYKLWHGEQKRIDVSTLAALCDVLKIKPGQLFEYTPDE